MSFTCLTSCFDRKLYIADARPRKNALANGAMGGGSESSSNYFQSEVLGRPFWLLMFLLSESSSHWFLDSPFFWFLQAR